MWLNTLLLALRSIRRNLLRSFLTVLGVVIGVAAVIAMVTIGNGTTAQVTSETQATLQKSFSSAEALSEQYPKYSTEIIEAARQSFLTGANWAYLAAIAAGLVAMAIVRFCYPGKAGETALLNAYAQEDAASQKAASS